jgi:hypothetical protein
MIESDAKEKICPIIRRSPNEQDIDQEYGSCIGTQCMAWRWSEEKFYADASLPNYNQNQRNADWSRRGYCGLAGIPKFVV